MGDTIHVYVKTEIEKKTGNDYFIIENIPSIITVFIYKSSKMLKYLLSNNNNHLKNSKRLFFFDR